MREGWYAENGAWYYYNESGLPASGWKNVNGTWYYLDPQKIIRWYPAAGKQSMEAGIISMEAEQWLRTGWQQDLTGIILAKMVP